MKLKTLLICLILINSSLLFAQFKQATTAIHSGIPWFDNKGNVVSAHGANIIRDNDRFYLFGEFKTDTSNFFNGFSCYSSADLYNWKFENMVLPVQDSGKLGPNRVGERVKVMKCPKTGKYIMFMHVDNLQYKDQFVGYATCDIVNGIYTFQGPLLFNGKPVKKWDMGVFQDIDGAGYVITHSGNLFKLSDDYKSITEQVVNNMTPRCEAPAIFKKDSLYYWLGSDLTSWERNDNYYFTATSLKGPWTERGIFAPKGTLTWNSQSTYILPIAGTQDTTFMFMGDRWAFPRQNSAATYVWQPLSVSGHSISVPDYKASWHVNTSTGKWTSSAIGGKTIDHSNTKLIQYSGSWKHSPSVDTLADSRSNTKGSSFTVNFTGTQIGLYGIAGPNGGYAQVTIKNSKGVTILSSTIEMYCKYPDRSLRFLSPVLAKDKYSFTVSVIGAHGNWSNKKGTIFGSTGDFVSVDKIIIEK